MKPTIKQVRQAFEPLTGREVSYLLRTWEVGINERKVRHIMSGNEDCPLVLYNAALWLQQQHNELSDSEYESLLTDTRTRMR